MFYPPALSWFLLALSAGLFDFVLAQQCRLRAQNVLVAPSLSTPSSPTATPTSGQIPQPTGSSATGGPNVFNYGTDKIRGVNLGGWFVLEPWITPSIFENTNNDAIVDEYTFGQMQEFSVAQGVLTNHWATWITEDDFKAINAAGLNHVRIPVGFWSIPQNDSVSPYIPGAWPYLLQALNWAKAHNIHVILDLHGAPGSQNGYDNSGQRTSNPTWASDPANVQRTVNLLQTVGEQIGGMVDVVELLNEAAAYLSPEFPATLRQFWMDAYTAVRSVVPATVKIMIGDAFLGVDSWQNFLTYPNAQGVMMDYHEYQIFSDLELSRTWDEHISFACTLIPDMVTFNNNNLWVLLGEWSGAPTDCAKWLNGRGVGARWDNTWFPSGSTQYFGNCTTVSGDSSNFSDDYKTFLRKYWEVQVVVGERVQGWVWWTWRTEIADEWSYQKGLAGGWIPKDASQRLYPTLCQ
ncbi:glycoside hydrolase [Rickenella mellea]|uniref:Glycoside hydrolase n=1 Tax=Rickenella mellea TaxID=50990 RepID=A0A4Y7QG84_9AGAM|nr:glycoside hydrolase [Rickenella mellea]